MLAREGEKDKEEDEDFEKGLSDKDMGKIILWQLSEGLSKIDASQCWTSNVLRDQKLKEGKI